MRPRDILDRLHEQPFKPFRLHLSDGTALDVPEPRMMIVGESSAVLPDRVVRNREGYRIARHWRTIVVSHIVQLTDLEGPASGRRRRKK